jgi:hypothetical protein
MPYLRLATDNNSTAGRPDELSQDPISQQSDEQASDASELERYRPRLNLKINSRPRKRIRAINISLFRMPEQRHLPPDSMPHQQVNPSYSDGFEGKEATPTGLYMPVKRPARRRGSYQKITIRLSELTIVSEKPSEKVQVEPHRRLRKNLRRRRENTTFNTHGDVVNASVDGGEREASVQAPDLEYNPLDSAEFERNQDHMLVDCQQEETEAGLKVPEELYESPLRNMQERNTPRTATSEGQMSETPTHIPLKWKQSAIRGAKTAKDKIPEIRKFTSQRPIEATTRSEELRICQQLSLASAQKRTPARARTESLEVARELMMVSVQRRPAALNSDGEDSDGEEDSERESAESYSESGNEDEDESEEDEVLTPEDGSESGEETDEKEAEPPIQQEMDIEDDRSMDYCPGPIRDDSKARYEQRQLSANSKITKDTEAEQKLLDYGYKGIDTCIDDHLDQLKVLQQTASQVLLQMEVSNYLRTPIWVNESLSDNDNQGVPKINDIPMGKPSSQQSPLLPNSGHSEHPDSSWRPRLPDTSDLAIEPEEEIADNPTPMPLPNNKDLRRQPSRRYSRFEIQLTMARSRRTSPIPESEATSVHDSQGSVILGNSQRRIRRSSADTIPETQLNDMPETPETRTFIAPQTSYMQRAIGQLSQPILRSNLTRTKSMPAHAFCAQPERDSDTMMAGGTTMTAAFQHRVSPAKSACRMPSLMEEISSQEKSLKTLTRHASLNMGTMPGSARKRMGFLRLKPPFLR